MLALPVLLLVFRAAVHDPFAAGTLQARLNSAQGTFGRRETHSGKLLDWVTAGHVFFHDTRNHGSTIFSGGTATENWE